ncbi:NUDIX hydrolase [Microvirga sp. ACRRW]|uniref:NUDIX hydrolase n=1 Tax=Microvirga sp. ACRRW TaxID=2918205 RepID=UPI001EF62000|nr:NUDIX hydrolase [Microvirga sp. ACRRW]MCG7394254.1 NUDIX hydrolase [Microvirga sp. ACRRW]
MIINTTLLDVDELDFDFAPRAWDFESKFAGEIDAHWQGLLARNPAQFNGRVLLLDKHQIVAESGEKRVLRGTFLETDYKSFSAWRDFGWPDPSIRNCFAMAALISDDGAFLLGEMSTGTSLPGRIQFPAGTPDLADVMGLKVDLEASAFRELHEETTLSSNDVVPAAGWTLVLDGPRIACMKPMRAKGTAEEIVAKVTRGLAQQRDPELVRLHIVRDHKDLDEARIPAFMLSYLRSAFSLEPEMRRGT